MKIILNSSDVKKSFAVKLLQGLLLMATLSSVSADDTEIFYTESDINSNVLFIMDNSGSMNESVPGTTAGDEEISFSYKIAGSKDDAEQKKNKSVSRYSSDLEMVKDGSNVQKIGLRFRGIAVPQDAEIVSAYIQFTSDHESKDKSSDNSNLQIKIQKHNNPGEFKSSSNNIGKRGLYSEKIDWEPSAWNTVSERGANQKTPNLKDLVKLVVARGGWQPNNSMVFVITGQGKRSAQSYDHSHSKAPELTITYKATGEKTRMQVMQSALKTVLKDAPTNLSVGIMNYGDTTSWRRDHPNGVKFPVTSVNALARPIVEKSIEVNGVPDWSFNNIPEPVGNVTVRTFLAEIADSWEPKGMTPIVDALYEAALYYKGDPIYRGYEPATKVYAAHPATYTTPAPNLIEPIQQTSVTTVCGATRDKKIYDYAWDDRLTRWLDGDTGSYKCPLDPSNPTEVGSSGANCAATKFNCGESDRYRLCNDWVDGFNTRTCKGKDEDGNGKNCTDTWTDGYCRNNNWGGWATESWCKFKVCKNISSSIPAPEYKTPTVADCQSNNIILMSDGKPEYLSDRAPYTESRIKSLMGSSCADKPNSFKAGRCGPELTRYLADNDINSGISGDQTIETFVIGFSSGISQSASRYLESLVTVQDDPDTSDREGYFSAQNEEQLAAAFAQTLDNIAQEARSQASPGYSVNVKSGLEHEDDIYIPVFDKSRGAVWSGNLKKFKLVDDSDSRYIRGKATLEGDPDANGYINAMTELGLFKDDAWDEYSEHTIPDGNVVRFGGTAALLTNPAARNLYTNVGGSNNLSASVNELNLDNDEITSEKLFDVAEMNLGTKAEADYREKLLNFIRGWDEGYYDPHAGLGPGWYNGGPNGIYHGNRPNYARWHMGDMLHSEPVVVTYKPATEDAAKVQYIFAATNEGYLHAFDSVTGVEQFAFMPAELLKNIEHQYINEGEHRYGIDGSISYHHNDDNDDGIVNGDEKVLLFFGMRRGGKAYYALDVTDMGDVIRSVKKKGKGKNSNGRKPEPKLLWRIDANTAGFSRLGQSWSMPYIANVKVGSTPTLAVIFTGGNDPAQDYGKGDSYTESSVTNNIPSSMGDDVYIVDAKTGGLLWNMRDDVSGASSDVTHAIPGGARILDVNRNGFLDRLYFADTGGFVWRLDLDEELGSGSVLTKFASLGGTGSNARKFYNEPDIALMRSNGKTRFSVSVGSGLRPHPMNEEIDDRMFVLLDESPYFSMPSDCSDCTIEMDDLESITITTSESGVKNVVKSADFEGKKITETDKRGWHVGFSQSGEKILASSITFEGSIVFTTLVPKVLTSGNGISVCAAPSTQGRLYAMDLLTGEASMNLDNSVGNEITDNDVFETISASEIPGTPQTVFNKLECVGDTCKHDVDVRIGKKSTQAGTTNVSDVESVYWNTPEQN